MRKHLHMLADKMEIPKPPARQQEIKEPKGASKTAKAHLIKTQTRKSDQPAGQGSATVQLNPPHGSKDDFERMSITLPPEMRQRLLDESNKRKKERSPDWSISVIVREALDKYL